MKIVYRLHLIFAFFAICSIGFLALTLYKSHRFATDPKYAWMDRQIEEEFQPYLESGITLEMLTDTHKPNIEGWEIVRYKIVRSHITGPEGAALHMLKYLVKHFPVPDVEFLYMAGDGIISFEEFAGPLFVSAKRKDLKNAIMYHDWYFYIDRDHHDATFNWTTLRKKMEKLNKKVPWEEKKDIAFWRGWKNGSATITWSPSTWKDIPRGQVCYLSHLYPELLNAGLSGRKDTSEVDFTLKEGICIVKPSAKHEEHLHYKYQICLDGHTCTYPGYEWRLLSNCCVIKQETPQIMWYYSELKPWKHYIPTKEDLTDLIEKIKWAKEHDEEAHQIAINGQKFAREILTPECIALYCYKVLLKYAALQKFKVSETL